MKVFLKNKGIGFYTTVCFAVLAIVTAVLYSGFYANYVGQMSWQAFWLLICGAVVSVVLHLLHFGNISPWVLAGGVFGAVLMFIRAMYSYIAVVMVGIDLNSFSPQFMTCSVLLGICLAGSIVNVYLIQEKEVQD